MKKSDIQEFVKLEKEIADIEKKISTIEEPITKDSVQSSSKYYPYIRGTVKIEGIMKSKQKEKLREALERRLKKLNNKMIYIHQNIDKIEDSDTRRIIDYILEGMNYVQIAHKMNQESNKEYTEDSVRMKVNRIK